MENWYRFNINQDMVEALVRLGLTSIEARVYLATLLGCTNATLISKITHVSSGDVYRALTSLQARGLMSKKIGRPTIFIPLRFSDGIRILNALKIDAEKKMESTLNKIGSIIEKVENYRGDLERGLMWIPPKLILHTAEEICNNAKEEVYGIFSLENMRYISTNPANIRKDIIRKFITEKSTSPSLISFSNFKGRIELRYQEDPVTVNLFFNDTGQTFMTTVLGAKIGYFPNLFSDNPCLAKLIRDYFDIKWKLAVSLM